MQYRPGKLLLALGMAGALVFGALAAGCRDSPRIEYIPEPENLEQYCKRTVRQAETRPGDYFIIQDAIGERLVDVVRVEMKGVDSKGYMREGGFDSNPVSKENLVKIERPAANYVRLTVGTREKKPIASYLIEFLGGGDDSVTLRFGPERCFAPGESYGNAA